MRYVFDSASKWNADKQYGTHKRSYIGKMVDGVFVPNAKHQLEEALEEAKTARQPGPVPIAASSRLFCVLRGDRALRRHR
jgi:hypothetical protein